MEVNSYNKLSNSGSCVVKCENPSIILHPYAKSYFCKYGSFVFNGIPYPEYLTLSSSTRSTLFDGFVRHYVKPFFKQFKQHPERSFTQDSLLLDYHFIASDGELLPMFLIVPCGKCSVCSYTKLNDISARCQLETYTSKSKPLFVTLTYDNEHLPEDGSVSIDDIQKFLKLLRINIQRFFASFDSNGKPIYPRISLRYIYSSEYTPNHKRPHYHLLIWNVPYLPNGLSDYQIRFFKDRLSGYDNNNSNLGLRNFRVDSCLLGSNTMCDLGRLNGYDTLKKLIWCSWKKGFIQVQPSRDAGSYVAKYIGKGCDVPKGLAPCFVHWSTRRGLGYDAYDLYFKSLLMQNPSLTSLTFTDCKVGKTVTVPIPKYYRSLLCPSLSVLASSFKDTFCEFRFVYNCLKYVSHHKFYFGNFSQIKDSFKSVCDKFRVFEYTLEFSVNPLTSIHKRTLDNYIPRNCFCDFRKFYTLCDGLIDDFNSLYERLMSLPLDNVHLQEILDYKRLNTIARVEFAKLNCKPLSLYIHKSNLFYTQVDRKTRCYNL